MAGRARSARRRVTAAWLAVIVLGGCVWWGLHPPRTEQSYRQQSAHTVELLRSNVETARLWLAAMKGGKVTSAATEVALTETETDAVSGLASYSSGSALGHPTRDTPRRHGGEARYVLAEGKD